MTTFKVDNVKKENKMLETTPASSIFENNFKSDLEHCGVKENIIHLETPGIAGITQRAFDMHLGLILDPETAWATILAGLAKHIELNAEELRSQFVDFEGKVFIEIHRDGFKKGQENPWHNVFPEFSDKIAEYIGKKRDLIVSDFSTTTPTTKLISEIGLMDAMKQYFDYGVTTACGIPEITIEGTVDDWKNIKHRVQNFDEFGLSFWTSNLIPVLDEIIAAKSGNPNIEFWKDFYSEGGGSGGPFINGHVLSFYAYDKRKSKLSKNSGRYSSHLKGSDLPAVMHAAPFVWDYNRHKYSMEFFGGIAGAKQDEDGSIRAAFGWGVREASIPLSNFAIEKMYEGMPLKDITTKESGSLKRVDVITFEHSDSRMLDTVAVEWETSGLKEYKSYQLENILVVNSKGDAS